MTTISAKCATSIHDATNGDTYDCDLPAGHKGPCRFDPNPRGRDALTDALAAAEARAEKAERECGESRREYIHLREASTTDEQTTAKLIRQRDEACARAKAAEARLREVEALAQKWESGWGAGQTTVAALHREHAADLRSALARASRREGDE